MSALDLALLAGTAFCTSALAAVSGLGGGSIMIAVLLLFFPPAVAIPFQGMVQMVGAGERMLLLRRYIAWPLVWRVGVTLPLGAALGLWLFQGLSKHAIETLIGIFLLLTLFSGQIKLLRSRELPLWGFLPLGLFMGALSVTVAVVAMFSAPFMIRKDMSRQSINSTMASMAVLGHITKIAAFGFIGFNPLAYWAPFVAMFPAVLLGTVLGARMLHWMSERVFLWLFRVLLVGLAVKMVLWDGVIVPYFLS